MALSFKFSFAWSPKPRTHRLIVLTFGLVLLVLTIGLSVNSVYELATGERVIGKIVSYETTNEGRRIPIAQFTNDQGQLVKFKITVAKGLFELGSPANIIYFKNSSRNPKLMHFLSFWLFPIFTLIFAIIPLLTALVLWIQEKPTRRHGK